MRATQQRKNTRTLAKWRESHLTPPSSSLLWRRRTIEFCSHLIGFVNAICTRAQTRAFSPGPDEHPTSFSLFPSLFLSQKIVISFDRFLLLFTFFTSSLTVAWASLLFALLGMRSRLWTAYWLLIHIFMTIKYARSLIGKSTWALSSSTCFLHRCHSNGECLTATFDIY